MPSLQFSMLICNFWKVWWRVRREEEEEGGRLMGGQTTRLRSAPGPDESGLPCWGAGRELCSHKRTRPAIQDLGIVLVLSSTKFFSIYICVFLVNDFQYLVEEQNCYRPLSGRGRRPGGRRPGRRFPGRPRRPRPVYYDYYYDYEDYDDYYYDYDNYYEDEKFTSPARPQTSADAVKSLVEDSNSGDNQQLLLIVIQDSDIPSRADWAMNV